MKRTRISRRTPLGVGSKSLQRGSTFKPRKPTPGKRRPISPASPRQRAKAAAARWCVGCGRERSEWLTLDPAHIWPRGMGGCDHPDCVVPLCRAGDGTGCHDDYDHHRLELLPRLEPGYRAEVAHAVLHAGLQAVHDRLTHG